MKVEFTEKLIDGKVRITAHLKLESDVFLDPDEIAASKIDLREVAKDFLIEKLRREVFGTFELDLSKFIIVHSRFLAGRATSLEMESADRAVRSALERIHK